MSDFYVVRQLVRQINETLISERQTSCMDLSIPHQIRRTKCEIKDFTKMVDEFIAKNVV